MRKLIGKFISSSGAGQVTAKRYDILIALPCFKKTVAIPIPGG
jgi:flavoprotein